MREIFTSGSVGGAPGNRCFYLEPDGEKRCGADAVSLGGAAGDAPRLHAK